MVNMTMTADERDRIARDIDQVTAALAKLDLAKWTPQGRAMAFALAAANEVIHAGGMKADYEALVTAAWTAARNRHG